MSHRLLPLHHANRARTQPHGDTAQDVSVGMGPMFDVTADALAVLCLWLSSRERVTRGEGGLFYVLGR